MGGKAVNVYTYTYTCNISEEGKGSTAAKEIIFFQSERKKTFISLFFFYQFRLVPANRKKESVGKRKKKIKGQSRSTFYYTPWHQQEFDIKTWRDRRREPNPIFPTAVSCWPHLHTSNFAVDWPSCDFIGNLTHTPTSPFVWQKNKTTFVPSLFSEVAVQYNNYTILFCCSETPVQVHPVTVCWLLGLEAYAALSVRLFSSKCVTMDEKVCVCSSQVIHFFLSKEWNAQY